jgi:hypothetical protein
MAIIIDEVSHRSPWSSHKKRSRRWGGVLGYFFNKMKLQLAPLVVGLLLGPNIEKHFREALFLGRGDIRIYVESPIAVAIWLLVAAILIAGFIARRRAALPRRWRRIAACDEVFSVSRFGDADADRSFAGMVELGPVTRGSSRPRREMHRMEVSRPKY